jgi:hypothetical protein
MICKNYVVTGQDVNGDMEMENTAYISYTLRLLYRFLFDNGFSKEKLNALHLGLQVENHELVCYKNLMFTEPFFIKIENCCIEDKIKIKSCFFNSKNECCAEVTKEVEWFDHIRSQVIVTPKKILQHFNPNARA